MSSSITIESKDLDRLEKQLRKYPTIAKKHIENAIAGAVVAVHKQATRGNVPWKTGALVQTMSFATDRAALTGRVFPTRDYAIFVHEGTQPHMIYPSTMRALYWPGALHPVKSVRHPGNKANPFLITMREAAMPEVSKIFQAAGEKINQEVAKGI